MKNGHAVILCAVFLLFTASSTAGQRPIVAVFNLDGKRAGLSKGLGESLSDYLAARLTESGAYQVIPRSDLRKRLTDEKRGSYKECVDQACQIELGRELAAEKTLAAQVLKLGSRCTVTLTFYDLKKSAADKASTESGKCGEDEIIETIDKALAKLLGVTIATASKQTSGPSGLVWVKSRPAGIEFTKSEITVAQYRSCVEAGSCEKPKSKDEGEYCNWGHSGRDNHPVNCVDWNQATAFCEWAGGSLPTEDEWYAEASDGGKREYPWANQQATCDYAVMSQGGSGCGRDSTWPVCSKERGNSVSGLCDMSGNVWEWTSSSEDSARVLRGGSWYSGNPGGLRASRRLKSHPTSRHVADGFRCGRSSQ